MTAKEFVRSKIPNARAERQKQRNREVYWLIRPDTHDMYIASESTEQKAWNKAKKYLEDLTVLKQN